MLKNEVDLTKHRADIKQKIGVGVTPEMQCAGFHGTSVEAFRRFYETGKWPLAPTNYGNPGIYFCPADGNLIREFTGKAHLQQDAQEAYIEARAYAYNIQLSHQMITRLGLDSKNAENFELSRKIVNGIRLAYEVSPQDILKTLLTTDQETIAILRSLAIKLASKKKKSVTPIDIIRTLSEELSESEQKMGRMGVLLALDCRILSSAAYQIRPPELSAMDEGLVLIPGRDLRIEDLCGIKFFRRKDTDEFLK